MRIPILLILLTFVLAEIAAFILVGEAIGVLGTLALVLLGMIAGSILLRRQGIATLTKVRADLAARRAPARPLAEGAVLTLAALLIILPGFLSDLIGIALFIPAVREGLWQAIRSRVQFRPAPGASYGRRPAVIDLDQDEYRAAAGSVRGSNTPWRPRAPEA
jgi:UPF0716 protein FxsA